MWFFLGLVVLDVLQGSDEFGLGFGGSPIFGVSGCSIRKQGYVDGGPGKDGIASIDSPVHRDVAYTDLSDSSMVLGVYINETARAYPVHILRWHEIVNDAYGDQKVSVTYSVLAGSSVGVYVDQSLDSFGTSGKLYENNLVMYDRGTDSEWVQLMARRTQSCDRLRRFNIMHTKWATWREIYPQTQLLSTTTGHDRDYSADPYPSYAGNSDIYFITSWRKNAKPYNLFGAKSSTFILEGLDQQYMIHEDVISQAGSFAFKIINETVEQNTELQIDASYTPAHVLDAFGVIAPEAFEMKDYSIVVAYDPDKILSGAWLVATNISMNGTDWEDSFALTQNGTIINHHHNPPFVPQVQWDFSTTHKAGYFHAPANASRDFFMAALQNSPLLVNLTTNHTNSNGTINYDELSLLLGNVTVSYVVHRLPLFQSYWFAATAIYPNAYILLQDGFDFRFHTFDPDIVYQQPWRPWMIVALVVLSVLGLVLLSCTIFCIYHIANRKRFAALHDSGDYMPGMGEEMKLLVEAGLVDPELLNSNREVGRRDRRNDRHSQQRHHRRHSNNSDLDTNSTRERININVNHGNMNGGSRNGNDNEGLDTNSIQERNNHERNNMDDSRKSTSRTRRRQGV